MTHSSAEDRKTMLIGSYSVALWQLGSNLFEKRYDQLAKFYGTVFDGRPDCEALINVPNRFPTSTTKATMYMMYLEARFSLNSHSLEDSMLGAKWNRLHSLICDDLPAESHLNVESLQWAADMNRDARQQILACQERAKAVIPIVFGYLNQGEYNEAKQRGDAVITYIKQEFEYCIDSYELLALSDG